MSYVSKKTRLFKEAGDVEVKRKKSDGRMKTYQSATDARAWCDSTEDRRQYILELIRQGDGKGLSLGKYIPIEAIIDILLANKNAEIAALRQFIKDHGLTYVEKEKTQPAPPLRPTSAGNYRSPPLPVTRKEVVTTGPAPTGVPATTPASGSGATPADGATVTPASAEEGAEVPGGTSEPSKEAAPGAGKVLLDSKPSGGILDKPSEVGAGRSEEVPSGDETDDTINGNDVDAISGKPQETESIRDKQAAEDLLAGKTFQEQLDLLMDALAEKDAYNKNLRDLAEAAIAQLENIKNIVDDKDQEPKREVSRSDENAMNSKLRKLEEITQERDRLKVRVQQLETELMKYSELPREIEDFKKKIQVLDNFQADRGDLERRLDNMRGLEDEVRSLKKIADQCAQLDSANLGKSKEIDNLRCKCNDAENAKRKLLDKVKHLEREIEIMKVERNCFKCRLDDMGRLQRDYEDLLKKTQGYDALKAECATYQAKYEELRGLEEECNELRARVEKAENLEKERALLLKEIMDCECCINSQESEIKRLACHIDCLTQDLDKRQDQMKVKVVSMRAHLEKKDDLIAKSEQKLADVQCQLRNSIDGLSCETTCLRNRIEELEKELTQSTSQLVERDNKISVLKAQLGDCNKLQTQLEEANCEILRLKKIETKDKETKSEAPGDEHYKKILKQTRCAIKCLVEKLKKYDIGDGSERTQVEELLKKIHQLEGQLEEAKGYVDQMKACGEAIDDNVVSELKDKIRQLEQELKEAYATIEGLKAGIDTLRPVVQENQSLRQTSLLIQETAKDQITKLEQSNEKLRRDSKKLETLYEGVRDVQADKDEAIADLRKQLEEANKRHAGCQDVMKEMEGKLESVANSGGNAADLLKLKDEITVLHAEIDRLNFELEKERANSEELLDKLNGQRSGFKVDDGSGDELRRLREENANLLKKILELEAEKPLLPSGDLEKLRNDNENKDNEIESLKNEINRLKQELATRRAGADAGERDELLRQIAAQKTEINDLVNKIKQPTSADDNLTYQELDKKNNENEKLKTIIDDLERQLNELKKSKINVPPAAPDVQKTINDLANRLDDAERRAREAEEALQKCQQEKGDIGKFEPEYRPAPPVILTNDDSDSYKDRVRQLEDELAKQKKDCNEMIGSLKQQHERDIKNLQKRNESSITKVQKSQDELVHELNLKHDGEVSGLKDAIRKSEEKLRRVSGRRGSSNEKRSVGETRGSSSEKRTSFSETSPSDRRDFAADPQNSEQTKKVLTSIVKVKADKSKDAEPVELAKTSSHDGEGVKALGKKKVAKEKSTAKAPEKRSSIVKKDQQEEELPKQNVPKEESPKEEVKKKSLTIKTFEDVCICSKLPSVIPIAVPDDVPRSQPPLRAICGPTPDSVRRQYSCGVPRTQPPQRISCPGQGSNSQMQLVPREQQPMMRLDDSRLESPIRKIAELENKLLHKQQQTKQKVEMLQTTVETFKRELELERQKNNDLISRFANQSKTVASMMLEIDMVRKESTNDKKKLYQLNTTLKTLEEDLDRERDVVRSLNSMLRGSSRVSRDGSSGPHQRSCVQSQVKVSRVIPQFHTEVTRKDPDNRCKHGCFLKRACPDVSKGSCSDRSTAVSDCFEIDE